MGSVGISPDTSTTSRAVLHSPFSRQIAIPPDPHPKTPNSETNKKHEAARAQASDSARHLAEAIAKEKMKDLNAHDLEEATKIICGSARSMGIEVKK